MRADSELHGALDHAIDDLLASGAWAMPGDSSVPEGELRQLMEVAAQVLDLARHTPRIDATKKQRIWRRMNLARGNWGGPGLIHRASAFLIETTPLLLLRPASPGSRGCRPLRGVRPS